MEDGLTEYANPELAGEKTFCSEVVLPATASWDAGIVCKVGETSSSMMVAINIIAIERLMSTVAERVMRHLTLHFICSRYLRTVACLS
jgi:hypothetical protein